MVKTTLFLFLVCYSLFFLLATFFTKFGATSAVLNDARFWSAFFISVASAIAVVILTFIFSVPVAYFLTYHTSRASQFIEPLLIDIPQTFPPVAVGVIYLFMFGPASPIHIALSRTPFFRQSFDEFSSSFFVKL